ncbi:MAG: 3-hydroxyacyl-ACP dehydratase FabZ, partial [Enterococcus sp.]
MLTVEEIKEIIPHRYPMLLIDRVEELEAGKSIKAKKNVSVNE